MGFFQLVKKDIRCKDISCISAAIEINAKPKLGISMPRSKITAFMCILPMASHERPNV